MCKFIIVSIFLAIIFTIADCAFFKHNERVSANIEYFKTCGTEQDNRLKQHIVSRRYNRTHTGINMNFTLYELFDRRYTIEIELRVWGDGGWKHNSFYYKNDNACSTLYLLLGKLWIELSDALGANRGCPINPGFYHFEDFFLDTTKIPFLTMAGRFLGIAHITKGNVPQLCSEIAFALTADVVY